MGIGEIGGVRAIGGIGAIRAIGAIEEVVLLLLLSGKSLLRETRVGRPTEMS